MKKKLEADLISIAHRILKMKNRSDLDQIHNEAQRLYEKLSVLKFVEAHFTDAKPTIKYSGIADKLAVIFDNDIPDNQAENTFQSEEQQKNVADQAAENPKAETLISETVPPGATLEDEAKEDASSEQVPAIPADNFKSELQPGIDQNKESEPVAQTWEEPETKEADITENNPEPSSSETDTESEPINNDPVFRPSFELTFDASEEQKATEPEPQKPAQFTFDDLLGKDYTDPVFVTPAQIEKEKAEKAASVIPISRSYTENAPVIPITKPDTLNERMGKALTIGLNDRIAFMTNLFNNSSEDYNRVLSQLITFGTLAEAKNFIDNMVKPDYNDWNGKEEYEQRFMDIIEKRFA